MQTLYLHQCRRRENSESAHSRSNSSFLHGLGSGLGEARLLISWKSLGAVALLPAPTPALALALVVPEPRLGSAKRSLSAPCLLPDRGERKGRVDRGREGGTVGLGVGGAGRQDLYTRVEKQALPGHDRNLIPCASRGVSFPLWANRARFKWVCFLASPNAWSKVPRLRFLRIHTDASVRVRRRKERNRISPTVDGAWGVRDCFYL